MDKQEFRRICEEYRNALNYTPPPRHAILEEIRLHDPQLAKLLIERDEKINEIDKDVVAYITKKLEL